MKKAVIIVLLSALLTLCSCAAKLEGDYAEPINMLTSAINGSDVQEYLSVFEQSYVEDYKEYYSIINGSDLESDLYFVLKDTTDKYKDNYGILSKVSVTEVNKEDLEYFPANAYADMEFIPDEGVTDITKVTVSYTIEGASGTSEPNEASFIVYKVSGEYYLHPMHLMFVYQ